MIKRTQKHQFVYFLSFFLLSFDIHRKNHLPNQYLSLWHNKKLYYRELNWYKSLVKQYLVTHILFCNRGLWADFLVSEYLLNVSFLSSCWLGIGNQVGKIMFMVLMFDVMQSFCLYIHSFNEKMIKRTRKHQFVYFLSFLASFPDFLSGKMVWIYVRTFKVEKEKAINFKIITFIEVPCKLIYCLLAG